MPLPISELPPPPRLILPLPLSSPAPLQVSIGQQVAAGERLAAGGQENADIIAPLAGRVAAVQPCMLASGGETASILLDDIQATAAQPVIRVQADSLPLLLKRAGIVGLGGAAYPAWRKWRKNLRFLIANGLETEADARHDAALMAAVGAALPARVAQVAAAFGAAPLLALPQPAPLSKPAQMSRYLPADYALGNERLLIKALCGIAIPPGAVPADYGVVCFNIATILAMADTLSRGEPLRSRLLTVHEADGKRQVLRIPFGVTVGDVRRFVAAKAAAFVGGEDELRVAADEAVLNAAVSLLRFGVAPRRQAAPCIRCGACETVCPVGLSPLRLYQLAQDEQLPQLEAQRLADCLACRGCDAVCPSAIPLTAVFIQQKQRLAAMQTAQRQVEVRRQQFDRHQQNLQRGERRISAAALRRQIRQAVGKGRCP